MRQKVILNNRHLAQAYLRSFPNRHRSLAASGHWDAGGYEARLREQRAAYLRLVPAMREADRFRHPPDSDRWRFWLWYFPVQGLGLYSYEYFWICYIEVILWSSMLYKKTYKSLLFATVVLQTCANGSQTSSGV